MSAHSPATPSDTATVLTEVPGLAYFTDLTAKPVTAPHPRKPVRERAVDQMFAYYRAE